jgi:hypothetical protein
MTPRQIAVWTCTLLSAAWLIAPAEAQPKRLNDDQVRALLDRIENGADKFKDSLDDGLDKGALKGTWEEDEIERDVENFERASDALEDGFKNGSAAGSLVQEVLTRASVIDHFVAERPVGQLAEADWKALRAHLDELASAYGVNWRWTFADLAPATAPRRLSDREMHDLVERIESSIDRLKDSLDKGLDRSAINDTNAEDQAEALVDGLDATADRLRDRFDDDDQAADAVGRLLWQARRLERFMNRYDVGPQAQADWRLVQGAVRDLAHSYGMEPRWTWNR